LFEAEYEEGLMSGLTELVSIRLQDNVYTLTLNHPKVNAINHSMLISLHAAFKEAASDSRVRCVLLSATGDHFSAGQDLAEAAAEGDARYDQHLRATYNPLILQIRQLEKPVLAAIHGSVAGAALGIALACDLRIAADSTRFVLGFLGVGLVPDSATSLLLPALAGLGRASQMAFLNSPVEVQTALDWGLVNRVVPSAKLQEEAVAWAKTLARGPLQTMGLTKRMFNHAILGNLEEVLEYEAKLQEIAHHTAEHREGLQAFLEKRPPEFYKA
jgi:2-(1,2-epoxy-1,2-dihydrophenyl)acetyl-CoA isomerase